MLLLFAPACQSYVLDVPFDLMAFMTRGERPCQPAYDGITL